MDQKNSDAAIHSYNRYMDQMLATNEKENLGFSFEQIHALATEFSLKHIDGFNVDKSGSCDCTGGATDRCIPCETGDRKSTSRPSVHR